MVGNQEAFERNLHDVLKKRQLVIFLGGDLPQAVTGLPSRQDLARDLAQKYDLPHSLNLAETTQRIKLSERRYKFTSFLRDALDITGKPEFPFYLRLATFVRENSIRTLITTAYDNQLENVLRAQGVHINPVLRNSDIKLIDSSRTTLIKLYGDIAQPETLVVTEQDHTALMRSREREEVVAEVHHAFRHNAVLFIGYDLSDPDFRMIFDLVSESEYALPMYAIMPNLSEVDTRMWSERNLVVLENDPFGLLQGTYTTGGESADTWRAKKTLAGKFSYTASAMPALSAEMRELVLNTRANEIKNYLDYLDKHRIFVVTGIEGTGKSDLVRILIDQRPENVQLPFWFDFNQYPNTSLGSLLEKLASYLDLENDEWKKVLSQDPTSVINYFTDILNRETVYWLVFDSVEVALEQGNNVLKDGNLDTLFSGLLQNTHQAKVILISSIMPQLKSGRRFINELDPDANLIPPLVGIPTMQAMEILKKSIPLGTQSDEILERLVKGVDGNPFAIQQMIPIIKILGVSQTLTELEGASLLDIRNKFDQYIRIRTSEKEYSALTSLTVLRRNIPVGGIISICQTDYETVLRLVEENLLRRDENFNYGLSKLVRNASFPKDADEIRQKHHQALEYYRNRPGPNEYSSITELEEGILEWHYHAVQAKDFLSAFQALFDTSADLKLYQWGEYARLSLLCKECLGKDHELNPELELRVLDRLGRAQRKLGEYHDSANSFQIGLDISDESPVEVRAGLLIGKAESMAGYMNSEDLQMALEVCESGLQLIQDGMHRSVLSEGLHVKGIIYREMGDYSNAKDFLEQARIIYSELGDIDSLARIWLEIGTIYHYVFDFPNAIKCYEKVQEFSVQTGKQIVALVIQYNLGDIKLQLQQYSQAKDLFENSYLTARKYHLAANVEIAGLGLAEAFLRLDELEQASELLNELKQYDEIQRVPWKRGTYLRLIALSLEMQEQTGPAEEKFKQAIAVLSDPKSDSSIEIPLAYLDYGNFLATLNRDDEALVNYEKSRVGYRSISNPYGEEEVEKAVSAVNAE